MREIDFNLSIQFLIGMENNEQYIFLKPLLKILKSLISMPLSQVSEQTSSVDFISEYWNII